MLDIKYRKILLALDKNARRSDAEIGKEVGLSREVVAYRISRLQEMGVVKGFVAVLNTPKLGMINFRVHMKFNSLTKALEEEIKQELQKGALWIVRVRGPWDFNTIFNATSHLEFKRFWDAFKQKFGNYLQAYTTDVVTKIHHYKRMYLASKKQHNHNIATWGAFETVHAIDELDEMILKQLEHDARKPTLHIANDCNVSERVVRYRIKQLIKDNIILEFRPSLNLEKLGYIYVKVTLKLQDVGEAFSQIQSYAVQHPNIVYMTESIGGPDAELEYQVTSMKELYSELDLLRDHFGKYIQNWSFMEYIEEAQLSYFHTV